MTGHTPGPWQFWEGQSAVGKEFESGAKRFIADCAFGGAPVSECEANARLIASAPELITALRTLLEALDDAIDDLGIELFNAYGQAVEAIAKAEGRDS